MRISRSMAENLCRCTGHELIQHEELGNRAKPYYTYSVIDSRGNAIIRRATLKSIYAKMSTYPLV